MVFRMPFQGRHLLLAVLMLPALVTVSGPAAAADLRLEGDAGVRAGAHIVAHRADEDGGGRLVAISPVSGVVADEVAVPGIEFSRVPQLDAWQDTVVVGANPHVPDAPLAIIFRVTQEGTFSRVGSLPKPTGQPCYAMTFALEGPEDAPHLTVLCQEGAAAVLVTEGRWPDVTLATAFRFDLSSETVLGTAVVSKDAPRSALVAMRGLQGLDGWALASLTEGNRVSPIIDGKSQAPVRVVAGNHQRLSRLILTGDPGLEATLGFDFEGQGGWRFLPPGPGDIALLARSWRNWLAIGWAAPGTSLPFAPDSAAPMRVALYDLSAIASEQGAPVSPVHILESRPTSRLWLGEGALVVTTPDGIAYHDLQQLSDLKP